MAASMGVWRSCRRAVVPSFLAVLAVLLSGCKVFEELQTCLDSDVDGDEASATNAVNATNATPTSTLLPAHTRPANAAELTGVSKNSAHDLSAFTYALGLNSFMLAVYVTAFTLLRPWFPQIYSHNAVSGHTVIRPSDTLLGWATASLRMSTEQAIESAGLDGAMLIEFCTLCAKVLGTIALPLVLVVAPLSYHFGGGAAGDDALSRLGMGNIAPNQPWLYHLHAIVIWGVVVVTRQYIYRAQAAFLKLRFQWLQDLKPPRSTTVLVQNIPKDYRSDVKLREFLAGIFPPEEIQFVHVLKHTRELDALVARRDSVRQRRHQAELRYQAGSGQRSCLWGAQPTAETIASLKQELGELEERVCTEKAKILAHSHVGGINTSSGFVTFRGRREAEIAQNLRYSADRHEWWVSMPPEPSDVSWTELKREARTVKCSKALGYACIAGLYFGFFPICMGIATVAETIRLPTKSLQDVWQAFVPTLGLLLFLSFLPSIMLMIFRRFFANVSDTLNQHRLHVWYFCFQVVFVILVTAVGNSLVKSVCAIVREPTNTSVKLAESMPSASNFYLNFLVVQWATQGLGILRYMNLAKFLLYRTVFPEEEAREMAEPEDQDYFGIGSRSARFTINMLVAVIFSTISPLIAVAGAVNFALNRLLFGYLIVYAETKKNDLGGVFWVTQLKQLFFGLVLYCVLMIGVLTLKSGDWQPLAIAVPALGYTVWSFRDFNLRFEWEKLPFDQMRCGTANPASTAAHSSFLQPELHDEVLERQRDCGKRSCAFSRWNRVRQEKG